MHRCKQEQAVGKLALCAPLPLRHGYVRSPLVRSPSRRSAQRAERQRWAPTRAGVMERGLEDETGEVERARVALAGSSSMWVPCAARSSCSRERAPSVLSNVCPSNCQPCDVLHAGLRRETPVTAAACA
jgi:hypothetical protein